VNRVIRILLILSIGSLVLWEAISWGTRTWVKYKLLREPLPSITTLLPSSMVLPITTTLLVGLLIATTLMSVIKARKLFGLIPMSELVRHMVVLGPTGSGKTSAAKAIIDKVLRSAKPTVKVTILDWKGEYPLPDATVIRKINVWDVGGRSPAERAVIAVELLREVTRDIADISSASAALLLKELVKLYEKGTPTTKDVIERIEAFLHAAMAERRLAEANMAAALLRRLYWLQIDEERPDENIYRNSAVTIYDLSATGSNYLKTLYSIAVLMTKYYEALRRGADELSEIIIAEESQNYIRKRRSEEPPSIGERFVFELRSWGGGGGGGGGAPPKHPPTQQKKIGERFVFELRSFGVGAVLICPDPELLPEAILKDVGSIISLSPDSLPRFTLERHLFRASLEEAENVLKRLKKARMVVYYKNRLHFFRRLPKPPKLKARPKGDRMGVFDSGVGLLRAWPMLQAWPILPHRSPGRPLSKTVEVKEVKKPEVIEIREEAPEAPKVVEVKTVPTVAEELRLEEEEEPEVTVTEAEKPAEEEKFTAGESVESAVEIEEEVREAVESEPAPKGPPIPSSLPYWVQGRPAQPGAPPC
jgi:GTPase SAR1 family protein